MASNQAYTTVILDRDGVINLDSPDYIKSADEWLPVPGSIEAIAKLKEAGFNVALATNQSGLARGLFKPEDLEAMHAKMCKLVEAQGAKIDYIAFCPHHPGDNCECRKPKPGLLLEINEALGIDLTSAYFVGDSYKDIQAARAVGATPILVLTGKGESTLEKHPELSREISVFSDLKSFVGEIL